MQRLTEEVFHLGPPGGVFDGSVIRALFPEGSDGARKQLVVRAVAHGEVLRLKPGLFCLAPRFRKSELHPFALAAVLHGPSHVSCESALAFHGLIPESVPQVVSVTLDRSRTFDTPMGRFAFLRVPTRDPLGGVHAHELPGGGWAFLASPARAIADLVYLRRDVRWREHGLGFLTSSLRIEIEDLGSLEIDEVVAAFRSRRVQDFLEGLKGALGP